MPSSPSEPAAFYDGLAEVYHLIHADWPASIERQGDQLAAIIRERWSPAIRLLDAACGIGTQSLGLAARGFDVTASDISSAALARARREAEARDLKLSFASADFRSLTSVHRPPFDVVIACDNSVPHLLTAGEILLAFRQMRALLRPGGGLLISVRDYDAMEHSDTQMVPYGTRETPQGRVAVFQVWDFTDPRHYVLNMCFVHDLDGRPRAQVFRSTYHAIGLRKLEELLTQAGFAGIERIVDRFFQPVLVGSNPGSP